MIDPGTAALAGAGIGALGDLIGGDRSAKSAEAQAAQNVAYQREFAQNGIRWRVEDAKAAGLHPLYAIGAAGASFAPNPITVQDKGIGSAFEKMGQGLTRAVAAQETQDQADMRDLQKRLITSQINESDARAQLARSQAAVTGSPVSFPYTGAMDGSPYHRPMEAYPLDPSGTASLTVGRSGQSGRNASANPNDKSRVKMSPDEQTWERPGMASVTAGVHPSMREFTVSNGRKVLLPHTFKDDAEIPMMMWPLIIKENTNRYGFVNTLKAFGVMPDDLNDPRHFRQHPSMIRTPKGLQEFLNMRYEERR